MGTRTERRGRARCAASSPSTSGSSNASTVRARRHLPRIGPDETFFVIRVFAFLFRLPRSSKLTVSNSARRPAADALLAIVANEWREMNTVNVATAWHRLAKLSKQTQKQKRGASKALDARSDARMQILERLAFKNVDAFDAMNLANVVWSLAVLDHHAFNSSQRFLRRACERIESAARRGMAMPKYPPPTDKTFPSAQAVSNCLWAFTTMKHPLAHALASLLVEITPKFIDAFDPETEAETRADKTCDDRRRGTAAATETLSPKKKKKTGGAFVAQTISNQLWCFGTLRRHPGDAHLDALARAVARAAVVA